MLCAKIQMRTETSQLNLYTSKRRYFFLLNCFPQYTTNARNNRMSITCNKFTEESGCLFVFIYETKEQKMLKIAQKSRRPSLPDK